MKCIARIVNAVSWLCLFAALFILVGCPMPGNHGRSTAPTRASISGAKGLFLQASAGKSMHVASSTQGRAIITASDATLGQITSSGIPQTADFIDDVGATVTVAISQALQLTDEFILLSYSYDGGAGTGILDMVSGALADLSRVPDNWALIYARGDSAWYESGGSIWRVTLTTGAVVDLSDGANKWTTAGTIAQYGVSWQASAWLYSDGSGNAYAMDIPGGYVMALCISTSGATIDFGNDPVAYTFLTASPLGAGGCSNNHIAIDSATGLLFLLKGDDLWDNDPLAVGGANITGGVIQAFPVTLDPDAPGVMSIAVYPTSAAVLTHVLAPSTYVGFASLLSSSVWSNGVDTVSGAVNAGAIALTHYDTSSVPAQGSSGAVTNWQWSGGNVYAGPASAQTISLVQFSSGTGSAATLVNDSSPIVSWGVVGGVLFYTDGTGTYSATVDTVNATITTPQVWTGGEIKGITQ